MLSKMALVAAGAVLVAPATSNAADRFASPTGSGTTCDQVTPCDIETAVNKASQFDDVTLTAGTYTPAVTLGIDLSSGFDPKFNLTIHGAPGSRPVVNFSASSAGAFYITTGSSLRDVDVNVTGNSASGVGALNGGIADRVSVHASGADDIACGVTNQSSIRDSVCWYSGSGGPNAAALSSASDIPGFNATNTVRNVTAIAAAGPGMRVRSVSSVNAGVTVNATNVIARGGGGTGGEDVRTERLSGTGDTPPQKVNLDHSNYSTESEQDTGDITDPASGTNLTTAPDFVDAAAGDFREKATSTGTINLGTATGVQNGELALGGQQRNQGGVPDIGADEYDVPNAPSLTGSNPPSGSNENSPHILGTADPLTTVTLYANGSCTPPSVGTGTPVALAAPGFPVSVADNSSTTFSATASNAGGPSACSTSNYVYTEATPTPTTSTAPAPAPAPKKKCKKRKHRAAAAKKCKRKRS